MYVAHTVYLQLHYKMELFIFPCQLLVYRIAGKFGNQNIWRFADKNVFDELNLAILLPTINQKVLY